MVPVEPANPATGRVILVSNRLPISVRVEQGTLVLDHSSGGVATGLRGYHDRGESVWIGWPGDTPRLRPGERRRLAALWSELQIRPVELTSSEVRRYYDGFCNGVLWPLLHYQLDRLPLKAEGWETYVEVNRRFADAIIAEYRAGDLIWVHDYHLALVPQLLRERLPDAPIGFFLHVPFPSAEVFRLLPWRRELLEGMLGASLVGFHTVPYVLHFLTAAANVLGCVTRPGRVTLGGRFVRVGAFPMGVDAAGLEALAESAEVIDEAARSRQWGSDAALVVSVDRLDYTKGIPRRLLAFERLLERYPDLRGRVRLVQVVAPSRGGVAQYRDLRRSIDETVGRIGGRFATPGYDPIHYVAQNLDIDQLVALFRAASVALVTPLRDGMNLVAKEFVASRSDGDGVLILSEFAGAAAELTGALLTNPYDLDDVANAIRTALEMPERDRRERMQQMRERVQSHDVQRWAREFLAALRREARRRNAASGRKSDRPADVASAVLASDPDRLVLILDYDGTLVGLRPSPDEASPDSEILGMLAKLALLPGVTVHVVTGRRRDNIDLWLGSLPIGLHAEHGLWSRGARRGRWSRRRVATSWYETARAAMAVRAGAVRGSFLEEKEASVAWHYRRADPIEGRRAADALRRELEASLAGSTATILRGHRVVEAKDAAMTKGLVVAGIASASHNARMLIVGDDTTDEDMFRAAPAGAITVHVGRGRSEAQMRLQGPDEVRRLLAGLIDLRTPREHPAAALATPEQTRAPIG